MKATTMTLSEKRQSVFPQDWCERVGLSRGGPVNVFDLGEAGLLIRPVKPPTRRELQAALAAARPRRTKPREAERIENASAIPYAEIPGFHAARVAGHRGELIRGTLGGREVIAFAGRFHIYEGHDPAVA